jgi:hypothetical protein
MKTKKNLLLTRLCVWCVHLVAGAALLLSQPLQTSAQNWTSIANPDWNIWLTDYGYSDYLFDNTPGFEGREYLCGEWGAAIGYHRANGTVQAPRFLDPHFWFPDWATLSSFGVKTPMKLLPLNADNLPAMESVVTNSDLQITLHAEMFDTIVGTPMGTSPASTGGAGAFINSSRYVMKQTATIKNISAATVTNVQFFQFLHGLHADRGFYDNRAYSGPLSTFKHDTTLVGVDQYAIGAGSSSAGLEDFIAFQASAVPGAFEIGHYGIEGNGIDDHSVGKPSDGVHLSVENNWLTAPYSTRQGTDNFNPPTRWVSGAQRWNLGALAPNQSTNLEVVLSLRTGTRVAAVTNSSGGCNGGSGVSGGLDYSFDDVTNSGSCFAEYARANAGEVAVRVAAGEFSTPDFPLPGEPAQVWQVHFSGGYNGAVKLTFGYDATILPPGFDENALCLYEFESGTWHKLTGTVDTVTKKIDVSVTNLGSFMLGVDSGTMHTVSTGTAPANSGSVLGGSDYADGSSVTLLAEPNAGYVFANWTEGTSVVSSSPNYTFLAHTGRTLTANFIVVGTGKAITATALPASAGSTAGSGEYAVAASATVVATPNPGYKFSKWTVNGASVSTTNSYTFTVSTNRALVAKFKVVYTLAVSAEPANGGEVDADKTYDPGDPSVMKAIPAPGWAFVNWTQNGVPVSTDPQYEYTVNANRVLVGHFAQGYRIDTAVDPMQAGAATGGGVHGSGASVTLEASPHPGYAFLNWTENGIEVETSPTYTLQSNTNHAFVANFIAAVIVTPSQPSLSLAVVSPGVLILAWPTNATGFSLEQNPDLSPSNWAGVTNAVTLVGDQNQVTVQTSGAKTFFRLMHP